jgi:hypothetical protein
MGTCPNNMGLKMRSHWEHLGSFIGTHWENPLPHPPPPFTKTQKKKTKPLNLLIGCMKFIFLK